MSQKDDIIAFLSGRDHATADEIGAATGVGDPAFEAAISALEAA